MTRGKTMNRFRKLTKVALLVLVAGVILVAPSLLYAAQPLERGPLAPGAGGLSCELVRSIFGQKVLLERN